MPSVFDSMMSEASGLFVETLGERDAQGDFAKFFYQPPSGDPIELVGWILTTITGQESINTRGELSVTETCKISGPVGLLAVRGIQHCQAKATVKIGEEVFHIDPLQTSFKPGSPLATIGLKRQPLVNQNEMRNAGI